MSEFKQYRRKALSELRPYEPGEDLTGVSVDEKDISERGSPKLGDMIGRNPKNHDNRWLVEKQYYTDNFVEYVEPEVDGASAEP